MCMKAIGQITAITLGIKKKKSTQNIRGHLKSLRLIYPTITQRTEVQTLNNKLVFKCSFSRQWKAVFQHSWKKPDRNDFQSKGNNLHSQAHRWGGTLYHSSITGRWELLFSATLMQLCQFVGGSVLLHQTHQQPESELPSSLYLDIFS